MRYPKAILALPLCVIPAGCEMPAHSNALLFATNTMIALDVSASPSAGAPNVTLGYKRQEAAWVPLLANKGSTDPKDRQASDCVKPANDYTNCVFKGVADKDSDAYSVLASLNGGTSITTDTASGVKTEANIGQYFATGLAARYLALKGGAQTVNPAASSPAGTISPEAQDLVNNIEKSHADNLKKIDGFIKDASYATDRDTLVGKAYPVAATPKAVYLKSIATKDAFMKALQSDPTTAATLAAQIS